MHEACLILNPARKISISEAWQEYLVTGSYPYMRCLVKRHSRDMPPLVHSLHFVAFCRLLPSETTTRGSHKPTKTCSQGALCTKSCKEPGRDWGQEFIRSPVCKTKLAHKNSPNRFHIEKKLCQQPALAEVFCRLDCFLN